MVRVKICGITNVEDARVAVAAGCDALGFLFYRNSPRYISVADAKEIIKDIPKDIIKIGVFVDAKEKTIKQIAKACCLDILQFHGSESPEFCKKFKNYKVIKVFRVKNQAGLKDVSKYKVFGFLFDTFSQAKLGGTGKKFNWNLLTQLGDLKESIFLSGGLNAKNVQAAIKAVHPAWVDASSSLESKPGKKDHKRVKRFIAAAKG
ncbi:MAG: phosphoribosylanthranilate isomerase [Candidatus Omnitrophica bacterium]|nr:phosphoribosylanthranilate isomerase [Candidatus Omnitrophota bacterium]MDD5652747.1 phosphoribosylanthranilate isomerase [Candidatus Omnitrophota bacterium]